MPQVSLSITPIPGFPGNYRVEISGSGFGFAANKEARWKLKGDDPVFDDRIIAPFGGGPVSQDGTFFFAANAISGNLNEDWGKDEVYAVVSIGGLGTTTEYNSNTVSGYY
ncbi:MAG TPA: hypothetical protein VKD90_07750 [Gemmataceae bacterium]|nr:hypothetical protein [Gemmataceae bacterium]